MAALGDVRLPPRRRLAAGDEELRAYQIEPGHLFGDGVLHLQPRVHLEEVELAAVDEELDGARVAVPDGFSRRNRRARHPLAELRRHRGRWALLDHFLMTALRRAIALEEVEHAAVGAAEHLHLDVAGPIDEPLGVERAVSERGDRLAARRLNRFVDRGRVANRAHSFAAAAGGGFDQRGQADANDGGAHAAIALVVGRLAGHHGHARRRHDAPRFDLRSHALDRVGRRTDEHEPRVDAGARERRILRQKAIAGMDRIRRRGACGFEDLRDRQVAVGRRRWSEPHRTIGGDDMRQAGIRIGIDRDGFDSKLAAGARDPHGNLAAIRDEEPFDHALPPAQPGGLFSRKALSPSWPSAETRRFAIAAAVIAAASATLRGQTAGISAFAAATASGPAVSSSLR